MTQGGVAVASRASDAAPALEVKGLTAGYSNLPILHDISATFNSGEITSIVGPNGAGKSTLLKAMFGIATIHQGTVCLRGKEVGRSARELVKSGVAYVPQVNNVFPTLTVAENLAVGTYVRGSHSGIAHALQIFPELEPMLKKRAGQLSGGQRSMLATARALVSRPDVLLVDEASAGLAPLVAERLWQQLLASAQEGVAVIVVEQNVALALDHSAKAYLLSGGRTSFEGTAQQLRARADFEALFFDSAEADRGPKNGRRSG